MFAFCRKIVLISAVCVRFLYPVQYPYLREMLGLVSGKVI